jgi:hypothetical protein
LPALARSHPDHWHDLPSAISPTVVYRCIHTELRFLERTPLGRKPDVRFLPALISAVRMDIGIVAIQRTFLDPVTALQSRLLQTQACAWAIWGRGGSPVWQIRSREDWVLPRERRAHCSAQVLFGIPCWATLGNERFGIVAVPESITELHLFVDADKGRRPCSEAGDGGLCARRTNDHSAHSMTSPGTMTGMTSFGNGSATGTAA